MNIGIIGNGFVGKAVKESFKNHFEVFIFDTDKRKANIETNNKVRENRDWEEQKGRAVI